MYILLMFLSGIAGNTILKNVDIAVKGPKKAYSKVKMVLINNRGYKKIREIEMWSSGNRRLMKFKSPKEVKGVGFLVLSDIEMYIYMPAYGKIRRIASHTKNQSFMGSDFSYNDMGNINYADDYNAKLIKEGKTYYKLKLIPKQRESQYSKVVMYVNKETFLPDSSRFFDKKGNLYKIMKNKKVKKIGAFWIPVYITMRNVKKNHTTVMSIYDIDINLDIKNSLFTKRQLKR